MNNSKSSRSEERTKKDKKKVRIMAACSFVLTLGMVATGSSAVRKDRTALSRVRGNTKATDDMRDRKRLGELGVSATGSNTEYVFPRYR